MIKKRLKHIDRQNQIIDIARELVSSGGIHNLTIRKLSNHAGITEAAFYRHFNSREDVIICLINEITEKLSKTINSVLDVNLKSLDCLEKITFPN